MKRPQFIVFMCWLIALTATLGSLFFSEIMRFPPCVLCWYQRIAMYPLVLIFLVGAFQPAKATFTFAAPLSILGWVVALSLLGYSQSFGSLVAFGTHVVLTFNVLVLAIAMLIVYGKDAVGLVRSVIESSGEND